MFSFHNKLSAVAMTEQRIRVGLALHHHGSRPAEISIFTRFVNLKLFTKLVLSLKN